MLVRCVFVLWCLVSGWVYANPCPANLALTDRLIPLSGEQWDALREGNDPEKARTMAMFPRETIKAEYQPVQKMADRGFDHLLGMWNAVTVYPCDRSRPAVIEFRRFEVVRLDPKTRALVPELTLRFDGQGAAFADGNQFNRQPQWFVSGEAAQQPQVARLQGGMFRIDMKAVSQNILHMWTDRIKAVPGHVYGIRAEVRVTGDARLQLAMDYWKGAASVYNGYSAGCAVSNNCEAWLGNWIGDTRGQFVTITSPHSLIFQK